MTALDVPTQHKLSDVNRSARTPYKALLLIGLGGLFAGVTGPLLSTFIPPLVRDALGDHRTAIGAIMVIDNVLFSSSCRGQDQRQTALALVGAVGCRLFSPGS